MSVSILALLKDFLLSVGIVVLVLLLMFGLIELIGALLFKAKYK